mmetsp:Transcript_33446/g.92435  ORF Transcript_33446/g.92435 Transcript_33446/m.92435 type:complete len:470 (-) Transcript_33446:12-1421(-)
MATDRVCDDSRANPILHSTEARRHKHFRTAVLLLAFAFLGVFGGFQAAQGLQTSINATLGFINLAALYGTFALFCLVAPRVLAMLESKGFSMRVVMFVSSLTYGVMALSNVYTEHWAIPIATNVLVGIAAPLLWTSQNDFIGRCAYHVATAEETDGCAETASSAAAAATTRVDGEKLKAMTASFNGIFFSIYQFAGSAGNIVASSIMLALTGQAFTKDVLFVCLGTISCLGACLFLLLPAVAPCDSEGAQQCPSLKATASLAVGDFRVTLLVPVIFTNGLLLASVLSDFATDITCPVLGASFTGFVTASFFAVNSVSTFAWGRLTSKKTLSRLGAFGLSSLLQIAFLAAKLIWRRPRNYELRDGEWAKLVEPTWQDFVVVFCLVSVFAMGDAFWESGPPSILQNFFVNTPHLVPAMANYKLWQSLGFATQFVLGAVLSAQPEIRTAILIGMCVLATSLVVALNCLVPMQ